MTNNARPRAAKAEALDESLADWFGWFAAAPLPAELTSLVEQLEAAHGARALAAPAIES